MGAPFFLSGLEAASAHLWAPSLSAALGSWAPPWDLPLPPPGNSKPSLGFLLLTGPSAFPLGAGIDEGSMQMCMDAGKFQRPQRPPWGQHLLPWGPPGCFVIVSQLNASWVPLAP